MQIEITTNNSKKVTKLLSKFLEMNENGIYDYFEKDKIDIFMKIATKIKSKHKGTKLFILKQNSPKLKELMFN